MAKKIIKLEIVVEKRCSSKNLTKECIRFLNRINDMFPIGWRAKFEEISVEEY